MKNFGPFEVSTCTCGKIHLRVGHHRLDAQVEVVDPFLDLYRDAAQDLDWEARTTQDGRGHTITRLILRSDRCRRSQ